MTRIQQRQDVHAPQQAHQAAPAAQTGHVGPAKEADDAPAAPATDRAAAERAIGGRTRTREIPGTHVKLEDNGKHFTIKAGENLVLQLPMTAGTGYEWRIVRESRSLSLPAVDEYIPTRKGMIGGSGTQQLVWKTGPMSVGDDQQVELVYARRGQENKAGNKHFTFTVSVKGEGDVPSPVAPHNPGIMMPTHDQLAHFVQGRVEDALKDHSGKKLAHAPRGISKASHYGFTKPGRESTVDAYVLNNHIYLKTQSLFPLKKPEWRMIGEMPEW